MYLHRAKQGYARDLANKPNNLVIQIANPIAKYAVDAHYVITYCYLVRANTFDARLRILQSTAKHFPVQSPTP
jgi:uncharacterized membrane protein (DUF485 family)